MKHTNPISSLADQIIIALASRCLARRRRLCPGQQLAVLSQDTIGEAVVLNEFYERRELEALTLWLERVHPEAFRGTALDIGANIGNHAIYFARSFHACIAYEPNPRAFALLSFNATARSNLEVRNIALSDGSGPARLMVPDHNLGGARLMSAGEGIAVTRERLDEQDLSKAKPSLIKLDVEGHELQVLKGGKNTIATHRPIIVLEQHASEIDHGTSPALDWLRDAGYTQLFRVGRTGVSLLRGLTPMRIQPLASLEKRNHPMLVAVHKTMQRA